MIVAIDTETTLISEAEPVPTLVSVATYSEDAASLYAAHDSPLLGTLQRLLERAILVFANAPFDVAVLVRRFPELDGLFMRAYDEGRIRDVLTREKLLALETGNFRGEGLRFNLGAVADRRAGLEVDKNDPYRLRYGELLLVDVKDWPKEALEYARKDAEATYKVYIAQESARAELADDPLADEANQARGHYALYLQTVQGLATDRGRTSELDERLSSEIAEHEKAAQAAGLVRVGGTKKSPKLVGSTKLAREMVEEYARESGVEPPLSKPSKTFPRGQISVSEEALAGLGLPEDHPLEQFRLWQAKRALRSKSLEPLASRVVRTSYQELRETGRTSSSGNSNYPSTNLQNLPRDGGFRECLCARPGRVFVISDWSAAELVTLSQVLVSRFGRSELADAMREGRDPHIEMACMILGIRRDEYDPTKHKPMRQLAKAANFGFPGGLGASSFVRYAKHGYGVELTESEAMTLRCQWFDLWPEMHRYFRWVNNCLMEGEPPPRQYRMKQLWSNRVRSRCTFTEACNTMFQGLAADAAKLTMWNLLKEQKTPRSDLFGSRQVLFVHDEIVTECFADDADKVLAAQERVMVNSFAVPCPDVPIRVESCISSHYRK